MIRSAGWGSDLRETVTVLKARRRVLATKRRAIVRNVFMLGVDVKVTNSAFSASVVLPLS